MKTPSKVQLVATGCVGADWAKNKPWFEYSRMREFNRQTDLKLYQWTWYLRRNNSRSFTMNILLILFLLLSILLLLVYGNGVAASSCTVSNCDCKGNFCPGMCSQCSGKNCLCDCPLVDDLSSLKNVMLANVSNVLIDKAIPISCSINSCNCINYVDCSSCSGPNCQCICSAATTGGCSTGSGCSGSSCYSITGSTVYCCLPGSTSCSISIMGNSAQCFCG